MIISVEKFKRLTELFKGKKVGHSGYIDVTFNKPSDIDRAFIDSIAKAISESERRPPNRANI